MYDPAGDARICIAKQHKTVLISDGVSQEMIDKSPPGLLLTPDIKPERRLNVIMALVKSRHSLDGKTVGGLTETTATGRVQSVVEPVLDAIGVQQGSEAVLLISGLDTAAAQMQLDSFIER